MWKFLKPSLIDCPRQHGSLTSLACAWLHHPVEGPDGETSEWYDGWSGHIYTEKRKLYIGGIFPMSGNKYVAPELAIGINQGNLEEDRSLKKSFIGKSDI